MGAAATRYKISDPTMFVPFIVVDVAGEDHDLRAQFGLFGFEISGEFLFRRSRVVSPAVRLLITRTRIWRVMQNDKDEIGRFGQILDLVAKPVALRAGCLVERTVE